MYTNLIEIIYHDPPFINCIPCKMEIGYQEIIFIIVICVH